MSEEKTNEAASRNSDGVSGRCNGLIASGRVSDEVIGGVVISQGPQGHCEWRSGLACAQHVSSAQAKLALVSSIQTGEGCWVIPTTEYNSKLQSMMATNPFINLYFNSYRGCTQILSKAVLFCL